MSGLARLFILFRKGVTHANSIGKGSRIVLHLISSSRNDPSFLLNTSLHFLNVLGQLFLLFLQSLLYCVVFRHSLLVYGNTLVFSFNGHLFGFLKVLQQGIEQVSDLLHSAGIEGLSSLHLGQG